MSLHALFLDDGHDPCIQVARQDDTSLWVFPDKSGDFFVSGRSGCDGARPRQRHSLQQPNTVSEILFKGNISLHGCFCKRRHFVSKIHAFRNHRQKFAFRDDGLKIENEQRFIARQ